MTVVGSDVDKIELTWDAINQHVMDLCGRWKNDGIRAVYGIPRGGQHVAMRVAELLDVPRCDRPDDPDQVDSSVLVVDDLIDSGRTMAPWAHWNHDALYRKPWSPVELAPHANTVPAWLVFPWEVGTDDEAGPVDAVVRLLEYLGEDPNREGLVDTPGRVLRALAEMTAGMRDDPHEILSTTFDEGFDEMVVLRNIEFTSLCEHHMLPFSGTVDVGYIAKGRVVGLSKLARLVECFARRLQVQERMTQQIAEALETELAPAGVGVVVKAHHSCMGCRGVKKPTAEMVTSVLRGYMLVSDAARREFLDLSR